jgi:hypothetical protein
VARINKAGAEIGGIMRRLALATLSTAAALFGAALYSKTANTHAQRIGMVIGIKPDQMSAYEALHAASNPGVRDLVNGELIF